MLIVRHLLETDRFQVVDPNGDLTAPVAVTPAAGYPIAGRPDRDLMAELRWYLDDFLEYPFHPETEHAERVLAALRSRAADAFNALFGQDDGAALFARATAGDRGSGRSDTSSLFPGCGARNVGRIATRSSGSSVSRSIAGVRRSRK